MADMEILVGVLLVFAVGISAPSAFRFVYSTGLPGSNAGLLALQVAIILVSLIAFESAHIRKHFDGYSIAQLATVILLTKAYCLLLLSWDSTMRIQSKVVIATLTFVVILLVSFGLHLLGPDFKLASLLAIGASFAPLLYLYHTITVSRLREFEKEDEDDD